MIWSAVAHLFSLLLELVEIGRMSDLDKDLEILVLRYQLGIADRKLNQTIKPNPLSPTQTIGLDSSPQYTRRYNKRLSPDSGRCYRSYELKHIQSNDPNKKPRCVIWALSLQH